MKKYTFILEHYNPKTRAMTITEKLTTKEITEERCVELLKKELAKNKNIIWEVKPYSKSFYLKMEQKK